jgi:hypothetical protein
VYFNTTLTNQLPINQQRANQRQVHFIAFFNTYELHIKETSTISVAFSLASASTLHCGLLLRILFGTHSSRVLRYRASLDEDTNSVFGIFPN